MILHAGLVALRLGGHWRGVLIEGPSGSGKSDLALRSLDLGLTLVADDRVRVWMSGGRLYGAPVESLAGLLEVRGLGVLKRPFQPYAEIVLIAPLTDNPAGVERMPEAAPRIVLEATLPVRPLWPFEPAAPAKLRLALETLGARR